MQIPRHSRFASGRSNQLSYLAINTLRTINNFLAMQIPRHSRFASGHSNQLSYLANSQNFERANIIPFSFGARLIRKITQINYAHPFFFVLHEKNGTLQKK